MRNDNKTDTKKIVRYRAKCWYQATIIDVNDKIEPGFRSETLRTRLVLEVKRSRTRVLAHLYIRFGDDWSTESLSRELLKQLIPSCGKTLVIDQLNQLKGQKCQIKFDTPRANRQKQSIIDVKGVNSVFQKRFYKPSWKNCALLLDVEQEILKAWKNKQTFATKRIKELPPSVKKLLFLFKYRQHNGGTVTAEDYVNKADCQTYQTRKEALRKAIGRTRCWLNHLDKRRNWGQAIEGTPKNGYVLKIPISEFRSRFNRTESNFSGNLPVC